MLFRSCRQYAQEPVSTTSGPETVGFGCPFLSPPYLEVPGRVLPHNLAGSSSFPFILKSRMSHDVAVSDMAIKSNGNLFLYSKTVKNRENLEFSKFPQQSILTIENTQISTDPSVSDRYLQDLCHHVRGIPACAALSPNISANRTFDAITLNLAVRCDQIPARRGTRRVGGQSSAKIPLLGLADSSQQTC